MSKRNPQLGRRTGKLSLPQVGITKDGKIVVAGVYDFFEVYGMPLDWLFSNLKDHNMIPDWIDLYKSAERNNMKHANIISKLKEPLEDVYGFEFAKIIIKSLTYWKYFDIQKQNRKI